MVLIWDVLPWPARVGFDTWAAIGAAASVLMTYICLLSLARLPRRWWWVRAGAIASASLLVMWIITIVVGELREREGMPPLGVLVILTGCGTICVVLLHWVGASTTPEPAVTTVLVLGLVCPRCGLSQELPAGRSKCRQCGLTFRIEIEEEHCPKCGYVLYRLTSDRCPECGTPVLHSAGQTEGVSVVSWDDVAAGKGPASTTTPP
jgi:hypothetical protein